MLQTILESILHPPILFFFLGILAVISHSDLEIPPQISKFLSLYLLLVIGVRGGEELYHSGFTPTVFIVLGALAITSFLSPFLGHKILKLKLDHYNAGAIAAAYGSISAVNFATAISFLDDKDVKFSGFMVAGMALMESPAIIAGLLIIRNNTANDGVDELKSLSKGKGLKGVLHEAFFNGSVFLLVGSMVIGYMSGTAGEIELKPFIGDIFKGMLTFYMLDMGLAAGKNLGDLRKSGVFLILFALLYPLLSAVFAVALAYLLGLSVGNAVLMTVLLSSSSSIAVPAAMRLAVPKANMGLMLPMSLGITFTLVTLLTPLYYQVINYLWSLNY